MNKYIKWLVGLVFAGTVIGVLFSLLRNEHADTRATNNTTDDDNFDLDIDLQPVANREYVPLTPNSKQ